MDNTKKWVEALHILPQQYLQWKENTPAGESVTFWCLKNTKINPAEYFAWAQDHYQLPIISDDFFNSPPDLQLWEEIKSVCNWSQQMVPLQFWDGVLYVGCVEPFDTESWNFPIQLILAPVEGLLLHWNNLQKSQINAELTHEEAVDPEPLFPDSEDENIELTFESKLPQPEIAQEDLTVTEYQIHSEALLPTDSMKIPLPIEQPAPVMDLPPVKAAAESLPENNNQTATLEEDLDLEEEVLEIQEPVDSPPISHTSYVRTPIDQANKADQPAAKVTASATNATNKESENPAAEINSDPPLKADASDAIEQKKTVQENATAEAQLATLEGITPEQISVEPPPEGDHARIVENTEDKPTTFSENNDELVFSRIQELPRIDVKIDPTTNEPQHSKTPPPANKAPKSIFFPSGQSRNPGTVTITNANPSLTSNLDLTQPLAFDPLAPQVIIYDGDVDIPAIPSNVNPNSSPISQPPTPHTTVDKKLQSSLPLSPPPIDQSKTVDQIVANLFQDVRKHYEKVMLLELTGSGYSPWKWDHLWQPVGLFALDIINYNEPSAFRITFRTEKPYHGRVSSSPVNDSFFRSWGDANLPACLTIFPVPRDHGSDLLLLCVGSESCQSGKALEWTEHCIQKYIDFIDLPKEKSA